jgi:NAD(P)-dependent dehydrogenase (short-subunit alcohol dehydrogenase family)
LSKRGFTVFATVRKNEDMKSLMDQAPQGTVSNIIPLLLDVTKPESRKAAVDFVTAELEKRGKVLFGLVNNAGISHSGPLEELSEVYIREVFDVNVFGPLLITRDFLPLLRQCIHRTSLRGRVVNIGSVVSHIQFPFWGPYVASKAALTALSEELSLELDVPVTVIEPSGYESMLYHRPTPPGVVVSNRYASDLKAASSWRKLHFPKPDPVADALLYALLSIIPPRKLTTGLVGSFTSVLAGLVPDSVIPILFRIAFTLKSLGQGPAPKVQPSTPTSVGKEEMT